MPTGKRFWEDKYDSVGVSCVARVGSSLEESQRLAGSWALMVEPILHIAAKAFPWDQSKVLDFGCGYGRWYKHLSRLFGTYSGVDICDAPISFALDNLYLRQNDRIYRINPESCPFVAGCFTAIWCCTVLQHLSDEEVASNLKCFFYAVRPQGYVVLLENTTDALSKEHVAFRSRNWYFEEMRKVGLVPSEFSILVPEGREVHTCMCAKKP